MALNAYLRMKGKAQGEIKGSVAEVGREDSIMVISVNHGVVSPRDNATGQPSGKRQHEPFVITKEADISSPLTYKSLGLN
ncbi:MAG: type VI secretion system tube protein TssD [Pseudomonadota bacterium]|nr:type VI secretion system tube protein TssD [Pseudomonadota bacterium]